MSTCPTPQTPTCNNQHNLLQILVLAHLHAFPILDLLPQAVSWALVFPNPTKLLRHRSRLLTRQAWPILYWQLYTIRRPLFATCFPHHHPLPPQHRHPRAMDPAKPCQ